MQFIQTILNVVLHLDAHLGLWMIFLGPWIYAVLCGVLFCETGLVVLPFLPGDSLLFAIGALSVASYSKLSLPLLLILLPTSVFLGDVTNYSIGRFFGKRLFRNPHSKVFRKAHLERTEKFYGKHGGRTVVLARFIPIVRTFAPFVAGMAGMKYPRFLLFSIGGGLTWIFLFIFAGRFFGNIPAVKTNFHFVILGILVVSVMPVLLEWRKARIAALQ